MMSLLWEVSAWRGLGSARALCTMGSVSPPWPGLRERITGGQWWVLPRRTSPVTL